MQHPKTLAALIARGAGAAAALAAPGRPALTYAALRETVAGGAAALAATGVRHGERVALVMPNGPEAATAFLAVASSAVACPLNPALTGDELRWVLTDLNARAVLVPAGGPETAVVSVAEDLGLPRVPVVAEPAAGTFRFGVDASGAELLRPAGPEDEALALHTSGTTARPKLVPLTHRNLCASARNIAGVLNLRADDRCLNVMPLFHVHGLVAALLAALYAGGSVWCAPGFNALRFFGWIEEAHATWMTAVPTIYQAILARAHRHRDRIAARPLRLLRSSSAAMPAVVLKQVEQAFGAPMLEAYGMTEASQQICSNPPGRARAGTVGPAGGPEVAILDPGGEALGPGKTGEVAIRGENVTRGYVANDAANDAAFTADGWFRTGDWGSLDRDGYLTIRGRIKEIINRGGEKVSHAEVEDALLAHPAVAEAVVFAVPHDRLGEDVGAAVVLRDGTAEPDLRTFAAGRLAAFKVPRTVLFLDSLPKGPTGKVARIGLAERLGLGRA